MAKSFKNNAAASFEAKKSINSLADFMDADDDGVAVAEIEPVQQESKPNRKASVSDEVPEKQAEAVKNEPSAVLEQVKRKSMEQSSPLQPKKHRYELRVDDSLHEVIRRYQFDKQMKTVPMLTKAMELLLEAEGYLEG